MPLADIFKVRFLVLVFFAVIFSGSVQAQYQCHQIFQDRLSWDAQDMKRDWGVRLLKAGDSAFKEPEYVDLLIRAAEPYAHGTYTTSHHTRSLKNQINARFIKYWQLLASQKTEAASFATEVVKITLTGSEANNHLLSIAAKESMKSRWRKVTQNSVTLISFKSMYIVAEGPLRHRVVQAPSPYVRSLEPIKDPVELKRIEELEAKALKFIKSKLSRRTTIGGILLEPITNAYFGLFFFRPEFLRKLRELADKEQIPIFADEIFTGGGRTGKFWAFEHYQGFLPDYITFGKGVGVAGVAEVHPQLYGGLPGHRGLKRETTISAHPLALLQSSQVLKTIYERNLIENSRLMGDYFQSQMGGQLRGLGLHLEHKNGRLSPPLNINRADIDQWILFEGWQNLRGD